MPGFELSVVPTISYNRSLAEPESPDPDVFDVNPRLAPLRVIPFIGFVTVSRCSFASFRVGSCPRVGRCDGSGALVAAIGDDVSSMGSDAVDDDL